MKGSFYSHDEIFAKFLRTQIREFYMHAEKTCFTVVRLQKVLNTAARIVSIFIRLFAKDRFILSALSTHRDILSHQMQWYSGLLNVKRCNIIIMLYRAQM